MPSSKRTRILNIPVDMVNSREALLIFQDLMKSQECSLIVTPNSEIIVNATKDSELKNIIEEADLVIPDGIGLVYASKIMGIPLNERVTGIDFLSTIMGYLEETGQSIFFLGSKPGEGKNPGIAELAVEKMKEKYKDLKVAGTHHGYFKEPDEEGIVQQINDSWGRFPVCRSRLAKTRKICISAPGSTESKSSHRCGRQSGCMGRDTEAGA